MEAAGAGVARMAMDDHASPLLQAILQSVARTPFADDMITKYAVICFSGAYFVLAFVWSCCVLTSYRRIIGDDRSTEQLLTHRTGSHFMQVVVATCSDALYAQLYEKFFKGKLEVCYFLSAK